VEDLIRGTELKEFYNSVKSESKYMLHRGLRMAMEGFWNYWST
jgi:hypothetical protein